jgi:hypothetical protein
MYDGTEDPLPWLNHCEQFFCIQGTDDVGKVFLASFYMMGDVTQWFTLVKPNRSTPSWEEFEKLVHQWFGPPLRSNVLDELIQLQRETTVANYQSMFLALVMRCTGLNEKHQIDIFANRLRNPLKTDVELEAPATLEDTMALAHTYEQRLHMGNDPAPRTQPHSSGRAGAAAKPLALPAPPTAATPPTPCLKRLTPDEMAVKRERGECYNCSDKFSRKHLNVCPMKGIYLFQMDDSSGVLVVGLLLSLRERMTLGVGAIFWFISHIMSCQPERLGLHIYSWSRQPAYAKMLV